jgi:deoxyribodipyrimidine photo-lyase
VTDLFPPTLEAAHARLAQVRPAAYARSRNHLDGAVTQLSPYLTHGFLGMPQVVRAVLAQHELSMDHKLMFEFGWREFFHHAWRLDGEKIFASLHEGVLPEDAYATVLPQDIRQACTGLPVIDHAVRTLYETGYLHNHARMWLASYVVHLRKVHWCAGADWLYAHLLDGDLASNHLSWQWVAGTGSNKPYLFNADNVARYAPPHWHCADTAIDTSYEVLESIARSAKGRIFSRTLAQSAAEPALATQADSSHFMPIDPSRIQGRDIWLVHPWNLAAVPTGYLPVAICDTDFHNRWPWSAKRWAFVVQRMRALANIRWQASAAELIAVLQQAHSIQGVGNLHLGTLGAQLRLSAMPRAFADPPRRCNSFFSFWTKAQKVGLQTISSSSPQERLFT